MDNRYTQFILTVIAITLVAIFIRGEIKPSYAVGGIQKVAICAEDGAGCLPLYNSMSGKIGILALRD